MGNGGSTLNLLSYKKGLQNWATVRNGPILLCSLVHKFGKKNVDSFEEFIKELESQPSQAAGELFLFVDECHRTQSGKLNRTMKAMLPGAVFIGFTGTPPIGKKPQRQIHCVNKRVYAKVAIL